MAAGLQRSLRPQLRSAHQKGLCHGSERRRGRIFRHWQRAHYITENFSKSSSGGSGGGRSGAVSPGNALRYLRAKYISRRDGRPIVPGDIFTLKAFFYAGTDAKCYKDRLSAAWGVTPVELASSTESTYIGAETWEHNGMIFFPDACFYAFIPEAEMHRNMEGPSYQPRTCLMDEIQSGETYELVLSVLHGGAFMRYRIGDMYHCISSGGNRIPRHTFVDRTPDVIDIAGFTRITASSMQEVIRLSRLELGDWILKKEFNQDGDPFLHMYLEIPPEAQASEVTVRTVLTEQVSTSSTLTATTVISRSFSTWSRWRSRSSATVRLPAMRRGSAAAFPESTSACWISSVSYSRRTSMDGRR